ncbi:UNVERIFIED_CONTAM: hypothetical protein RMT77_006541 [Armadillidium vulgare]
MFSFLLRQCFSTIAHKSILNSLSMNIIKIVNNSFNQKHINSAVSCLLDGSVIALPTDTIYGIACLAQNDKAIKSIYKIKKRKTEKPLAICVNSVEDIYIWGKVTVPDELLHSLLPGPVTLIFERSEALNPGLNPDTNLVGIRIPDHLFIREVVSKCGSPIALTSANISCEKSPLKISEFQELWDKLGKVFDGGTLGESTHCRKGSTIIDLSISGCYKVIRKGSAYSNTSKILHKFELKRINN